MIYSWISDDIEEEIKLDSSFFLDLEVDDSKEDSLKCEIGYNDEERGLSSSLVFTCCISLSIYLFLNISTCLVHS